MSTLTRWKTARVWSLLRPVKVTGRPELPLLSVYRDYGVIPKASRDDNHNRDGRDLGLYQVAKPGDVVMNKMKAWQGSIAVSSYLGLVSPDYMVLKFTIDAHPGFYHYLLRSTHMIAEYRRRAYGVRPSQWRLMYDDFKEIVLPVPPLPTQKAIANFLDRKTAAIDALIEKKEKLLELLAEKRSALINQAVTKGLDPNLPMKDSGIPWIGEIPEHWETKRLKFLVRDSVAGPYGSSLTKSMYSNSGFRVYGQQQVIPDDFERGDYFISPEKYQEMSRYRVRTGDVLVSVMGTVGQAAVVPEHAHPGIINPRLVLYRVKEELVTPRFMQKTILAEYSQAYLTLNAQGATMDGLNMRTLGELYLTVPPLQEQLRITDRISYIEKNTNGAATKLKEQLSALREYRQSLITAAVTGQLEIPAEDYE